MSGNDYKSQLAAERMKAQTLLVAKGLSRTQAERAAAAAARNVNAYGQKEEGPSRWQERKEAKRQMYLGSTEKPPILGVKPKASPTSSGGAYSQCQKCFQLGHWTYECKNDHTYISRPSRTQQLKNPKLKKTTESCQFVNPDLEKEREEERRLLKEKIKKGKSERREAKRRRKHPSRSGSDHNNSEASVFNTDTESPATGSEYSSERGSSSCSSSESEDKKRKHKRKLKKWHRMSSTSSASSDSESTSDSDSDDKGGRRKSRRRGSRH